MSVEKRGLLAELDVALATEQKIPVEVWRYSPRTGLYFEDGFGVGLTFDELAVRSDFVAAHDDARRVRIEFGPSMDDEDSFDDSESGQEC